MISVWHLGCVGHDQQLAEESSLLTCCVKAKSFLSSGRGGKQKLVLVKDSLFTVQKKCFIQLENVFIGLAVPGWKQKIKLYLGGMVLRPLLLC